MHAEPPPARFQVESLPRRPDDHCSSRDPVALATVYIETSIVSYLRQRPSSEIVMAAHQLLTHRWWNNERTKYELVVSQYVIDEAAAGDPAVVAGVGVATGRENGLSGR